MTDWGKVAGDSADKTDAELAQGITKLLSADIGKLFPDPANAALVRDLVKKIQAKTAYNERVALFKAAGVSLGVDLFKAVKAAVCGLVLAFVVGLDTAQASESLFDFGSFFSSARAGYAINQHLEKSAIFYTAVQSYHQGDVEMVNLDVGYEALNKRPLLAFSARFDNIIPRLWGSDWGKAHISTAKLPTIEFGPFLSGWPVKTTNGYKIDVSFGVALAVGFAINKGE